MPGIEETDVIKVDLDKSAIEFIKKLFGDTGHNWKEDSISHTFPFVSTE